jgi:hypothetical protein
MQRGQNTNTYFLGARNDRQKFSQTSNRDKHNYILAESKE